MSGSVNRLPYRLQDKERLFDVGQAVHANRKRILRREGLVLRPYTAELSRMRTQGVCFLALALLSGVMLRIGGPDGLNIAMTLMCLLCALMMMVARRVGCKGYEKALQMYCADNGEVGYVLFDEESATDYSEKGNRTVLPWAEYSTCVLTEEAIVLLYDRPVMLLFSRDEETEQQLRTILDAYGKGDTIHRCRVREKKKGR